jgi:hypothetical protein
MDARWAIRVTNELVNMKPLVVLAVRVMPPGRRRLEMVKLAHELDEGLGNFDSIPAPRESPAPPSSQGQPGFPLVLLGTPDVGGVSATDG